jgi:hypothetical protein
MRKQEKQEQKKQENEIADFMKVTNHFSIL